MSLLVLPLTKSAIINGVLAEVPLLWPLVDIAILNGAAGNGTTDDTAALVAALATGKPVFISPLKTYAFGSQLAPPSGGGFVGGGTLRMLTGTGKFDFADYTGTTTGKSGILIDGKTNVKIDAKIEMQANAAIRTCNPFWVQSSTNIELDVEITGFKESQFGLIEWNSNVGGYVKAYVHDCHTDITTGLPSIQMSGLSVDNNRVGGVNSRRLRFDVHARNITQGAGSIAAYGWQSDGVNLQGTGGTGGADYGGHQGRVLAENVGEPLDIFCDNCVVDVTARDCYFGVKIFHGASHNVIRASIHNFHKAAVVIGGANGAQGTSYNKVTVAASGGGDIGTAGDVTAALIDGAGMGAHYNEINVTAYSSTGNMDYIAAIAGGNNNCITYEGSGAAQEPARIYNGTDNRANPKRPVPITVAKLTTNFPAASVGAGGEAIVSDANATTFNSIVAGGGSNVMHVRCDGTNWRIG